MCVCVCVRFLSSVELCDGRLTGVWVCVGVWVWAQGSEKQLGMMIEELMDPLQHMVESVVAHHDGQEVVDTANYLMDGFAQLRTRQEPRLHAELMRAIQTIPSDTMTRVVRRPRPSS